MDKNLRTQYLNHAIAIIKVIAWYSFNDVADYLEATYGERPTYIEFRRGGVSYAKRRDGWAGIQPVSDGLRAEIDRWIASANNSMRTDDDWFYYFLDQRITLWAGTVDMLRWYSDDDPPQIPALDLITTTSHDAIEPLRDELVAIKAIINNAAADIENLRARLDNATETV